MESSKKESNENKKVEIITFFILNVGSLKLSKEYAYKDNLELLSQVKSLVIADEEGEEVVPDKDGWYPTLAEGKTYTIVDEDEIDQVPDEDVKPNESKDEEKHEHKHEHKEGDGHSHKHQHHEPTSQDLERQRKFLDRIELMEQARRKLIDQYYKKKHPHIFDLKSNENELLDPAFREAVKKGSKEAILKVLKKETETGIHTTNVFTEKFCSELIDEIENFQSCGLPLLRPNSMNRYGLVLNEIGFKDFFDYFLVEYVKPIAGLLYGKIGQELESHHTFVVQYKTTEDKALNFHYDDCDVTMNVCLGKEFTGGTLYFRGLLDEASTHEENFEFSHVKGKGMIHLGKHRHGANSIKSGERYNLIMWCRGPFNPNKSK